MRRSRLDVWVIYLPSDARHGAEAFGAQERVSVTSAATELTLQHVCHALPQLCNFTGPAVSHTCACTHTYTHTPTQTHVTSPSAAGPSFSISESVESDWSASSGLSSAAASPLVCISWHSGSEACWSANNDEGTTCKRGQISHAGMERVLCRYR